MSVEQSKARGHRRLVLADAGLMALSTAVAGAVALALGWLG